MMQISAPKQMGPVGEGSIPTALGREAGSFPLSPAACLALFAGGWGFRSGNRNAASKKLISRKSSKIKGFRFHGGIAQLGERLNGIQEVSGSIPLISTNNRP